MKKYPLIEAMELEFNKFSERDGLWIDADDLEEVLQNAPIMVRSHYDWVEGTEILGGKSGRENIATSTARLVCIKPIKKKTKNEAAIELLKEMGRIGSFIVDSTYKNKIKEILEMED